MMAESPITALFRHLASVLLPVGTVALVWLFVQETTGPVASFFRRYHQQLETDLRFVRAEITATMVIALQAVSVVVLCVLPLFEQWLAPTLIPLALLLPRTLLSRARSNRIAAIDEQIDTWLVVLANALRATPSLGEAIEASARLVPQPLSHELALLLNEYSLGNPLDEALRTMAKRLRSRTVNVALGALRIARTTGGNLPETLETSAAALREIARLEGVVRTKTAEGKAQAFVIAVVPFPMIGILDYLNPGLLAPLWETLHGYALLCVAFMLWLGAIAWARKILAVDI